MKLAIGALAAVLTIAQAQPALGWDPFASDTEDAVDTSSPSDAPPFVIPDGLYVVTDVYTGDIVTSSGATTTYATTTTHETPGTWARVVDTVGTGESSAIDGASLNGRARMPDGQLVAGTYYQDFVLTEAGFVAVNIVFFQDDSITIAAAPSPSPATPGPAATTAPAPVAPPAATTSPVTSVPAPAAGPVPTAAPGPTAAPISGPVPVGSSQIATAGVSLGETAPVLGSVEILRGRQVTLWPRAFLDGVSVPVRSWRLASGWADRIAPLSGGPGVACDAAWLTLAPAGSVWTLRFEVTSDAIPGRLLSATIDVIVRSPALEQ